MSKDAVMYPRLLPDHATFAGHTDAAIFLDAHMLDRLDWVSAVGRQAMFRIHRVNETWEALLRHPKYGQNTVRLRADLTPRALAIAASFAGHTSGWCERTFAPTQIGVALGEPSGGLMRFDKAVVLSCALNELGRAAGLGPEDLICQHDIAACVFYFANLHGLVEEAAATQKAKDMKTAADRDPREAVIRFVAEKAHQAISLINKLIGETPKEQSAAAHERAATHTASYRTQRAILKALTHFLPGIDDVDDRAQRIVRRHQRGSRKSAVEGESIPFTSRITRPPYDWPKDPRGMSRRMLK